MDFNKCGHLVWDPEVEGSNPLAPIIDLVHAKRFSPRENPKDAWSET
jgi:hypothetical protein